MKDYGKEKAVEEFLLKLKLGNLAAAVKTAILAWLEMCPTLESDRYDDGEFFVEMETVGNNHGLYFQRKTDEGGGRFYSHSADLLISVCHTCGKISTSMENLPDEAFCQCEDRFDPEFSDSFPCPGCNVGK
jgi:hypothetical protein